MIQVKTTDLPSLEKQDSAKLTDYGVMCEYVSS